MLLSWLKNSCLVIRLAVVQVVMEGIVDILFKQGLMMRYLYIMNIRT